MIDYQVLRFASPPRTANTWFRKVMADAGLGDMSSTGQHIPFMPNSGVLHVSMVRHPVSWLASYYLSLEGGIVNVSGVDRFAPLARKSANLDAFLLAYLSEMPGAVGWMFDDYRADTVLRVEDLPWAMYGLLESLGVKDKLIQEAAALSPQNQYNGVLPLVGYKMRTAIMKAEKSFCREYEYL